MWGGGLSLLLLSSYTVSYLVEEIKLFRVLVVRFVLSLMVLEISLDITILIFQFGREKPLKLSSLLFYELFTAL